MSAPLVDLEVWRDDPTEPRYAYVTGAPDRHGGHGVLPPAVKRIIRAEPYEAHFDSTRWPVPESWKLPYQAWRNLEPRLLSDGYRINRRELGERATVSRARRMLECAACGRAHAVSAQDRKHCEKCGQPLVLIPPPDDQPAHATAVACSRDGCHGQARPGSHCHECGALVERTTPSRGPTSSPSMSMVRPLDDWHPAADEPRLDDPLPLSQLVQPQQPTGDP